MIKTQLHTQTSSLPRKIASLSSLPLFPRSLGADSVKAGVTFFAAQYAIRMFDIMVSFLNLIGLFPVLVLVSFWIKSVSPGPIFYKQERVGKDGKLFVIYKFRTMGKDAEETTGPIWARKSDSRLIRGGKFLKDTHLDEVPQFFNVLKGDMAVVGPRPERPQLVKLFSQSIPGYNERLRVKPGLAGLSQITYDYDKTLADVKRKLNTDLEYIENQSLLLDLRILFNTFLVVITQKLKPLKLTKRKKNEV